MDSEDQHDLNQLTEIKKVYHKSLSDIRINNLQLIGKSQENLDKQLITLSTGIIAASIGFFVHNQSFLNHFFWWMIFSWWFLILTIFSTLASFIFSNQVLRKQNFSIEGVLHHNQDIYDHQKIQNSKSAKCLKYINQISIGTFILGIACATIYATIIVLSNMEKKIEMQFVEPDSGRVAFGASASDCNAPMFLRTNGAMPFECQTPKALIPQAEQPVPVPSIPVNQNDKKQP